MYDTIEKEKLFFFPTYKRLPIEIDRGDGVYLYTKTGERYLDLIGGLAVNVLGHGNKKVLRAINTQIEKFNHLSNFFYQDTQIEFAERLLKLARFERIFLASTGTEAIEGAIKLTRKHFKSKNKVELISFSGGFHGRTYGSLSITHKEKYRKEHHPFLPFTKFLNYNSVEDIEENIGNETAAVFLEFIQGEAGINVADVEFIRKLGELKKKYGFLIVADCIQCGAGRTGKFLSIHHYDIDVDVCVVAKGIGGGLPLSAIMAKEYLYNTWKVGEHGTTFGGNPVACAAGCVVLDELENGVMKNAAVEGEYLKNSLINLREKYSEKIKYVRGFGLMLGIEVQNVNPPDIVNNLFRKKILVNLASENVVRLLPPLIINKEEIDVFLDNFKKVIENS
jgi:predicted acetylornithine/succinylornithine family transaminase